MCCSVVLHQHSRLACAFAGAFLLYFLFLSFTLFFHHHHRRQRCCCCCCCCCCFLQLQFLIVLSRLGVFSSPSIFFLLIPLQARVPHFFPPPHTQKFTCNTNTTLKSPQLYRSTLNKKKKKKTFQTSKLILTINTTLTTAVLKSKRARVMMQAHLQI
uniref:Uncharacterized protein n=1 Tax=Trypanosoma vivax (strain Y486) TaxID=1055687 RepID=G0U578_TRYVY|nr:hypothetical protein, unlikely [Trypanosoma vivax Y486]